MLNFGPKLKKIGITKDRLFFIGGPCVIENEKETFDIAKRLKEISNRLDIAFIFKASFDKANRSSVNSYRGPGLKKGLEILGNIKKELNIPITTDIHDESQINDTADVADILQIPAFLCRQTDLLVKTAASGAIVNVKKGQFMAPWDMKQVVDKILTTGNNNILLTERGAVFGYNNLVADMRSIIIMQELGFPVIFDATHSVQLPGGQGSSSGGEARFAAPLAMSASAVGVNGLFFEVHHNPSKALCDGPNMVHLDEIEGILSRAVRIREIELPLEKIKIN